MTQAKKRLLFTTYITIFMISFALTGTMFSSVLPIIIKDYKLLLTQAALFTVIGSAADLVTQFIMTFIGDHFRKGPFIGVLYIMMGVMLFMIGLHPSFTLLLVFITAMNICANGINLMTTAYMSDMYGESRGRYINLLHMFYGLGSLLGPSYPILIRSLGYDWNIAYRVMSFIVLALGISYFVCLTVVKEPEMRVETEHEIAGAGATGLLTMLRQKGMIALIAVSFLYMAGHQGAFSTWFQTFLQSEDAALYPGTYTSLLMTIYWVGMALSRLVCAVIDNKVRPRTILLAGGFFGTAVLLAGLLVNAKGFWLPVCFLLGCATGAQYPLTLAIVSEWFPKNSARVISLTSIFSSVGTMLFGAAIGTLAQNAGFYRTMFIPVITLAVVSLIVLFFYPKDHKSIA